MTRTKDGKIVAGRIERLDIGKIELLSIDATFMIIRPFNGRAFSATNVEYWGTKITG